MEPEKIDFTVAAQLAEYEDSESATSRQHFPATDLIRTLLIYHISATPELSPHLHLSRQVVLRCTRAFEILYQLMAVASQPEIPINWNIFDAYTLGIPILESILLSFESADISTSTQQKQLPDDDDVLGALRFILLWSQERTQLVGALKRLDDFQRLWEGIESEVFGDTKETLDNTRSLLQSTPFLEIARDDLTTLTVRDFFDTCSSELSSFDGVPKNSAPNILDAMRNISLTLRSQSLIDHGSKDTIQQAFSSPHYPFSQIFIKSLMLITVPFSLLSNKRSNRKPLDDNLKRDLSREGLWKAMETLIDMLLGAVKDKSKRNNLETFEAEYARLRELLLSNLPISNDPFVDETLQLLRLSAQIFRPFQQRTVALIRLLHFLDQESSTRSPPLVPRDEIRQLFQETIRILEITEESFRGRSLRGFVTDEDEYNARATAFEEAFSKIRQSCKLLDPSNSWLSKETDFFAAVDLDETHIKQHGKFQVV